MRVWVVTLNYSNGTYTAVTGIFSDIELAKADIERIYHHITWSKSGSLIIGQTIGTADHYSIREMTVDAQMNIGLVKG